ncbi:jg3060, partial [Pararge aegeria aegeria]
MEYDRKVFSSNITRSNNISKNNLFDLLKIDPVQPSPQKINKILIRNNCDFAAKSDKCYVTKKKNGQKVRTVRDIRNTYEKDVYSYLPSELEKQKNILLRKIRYGTSKDEKTRELAINILKSNNPMSKSAWQMLMNINPEEHIFASQYILWKGKCIQVNGSKGGQHKFICNFDVGKYKLTSQKKSDAKSTILNRKRKLLHHSLNVKFKPGPLTKKKDLDVSYHKYQFGEIELIDLPKTGLEVETSYGKPLAPVIETFINKSVFQNDGFITSKWAKFALSVLGKNKNGIASKNKISDDSCVTFDLSYKCFQNRLLMRRNGDTVNKSFYHDSTTSSSPRKDLMTFSDIKTILDNVINAVDISLKQDDMYTGEDEPRETITYKTLNTNTYSNSKSKRNGELSRLDVTVITIPETSESNKTVMCEKDCCTLGCICDSLKCSYNLKNHCGRIECMFNCKCDFSKYKYMNSFDNEDCSDIIPGLINFDNTLGKTLAKEEHKFHQTVIVTSDKTILLKSDRRNWKTSKKYADFYSNMRLKTERNKTLMPSIVCPNLDCKSVEPLCMVHNLYKCFCKGKFTETCWTELEEKKTIDNDIAISALITPTFDTLNMLSDEVIDNIDLTKEVNTTKQHRFRQDLRSHKDSKNYNAVKESCFSSDIINRSTCARVKPYGGRKYSDEYYNSTHKKVLEMEKNDTSLRRKILHLINIEDFDRNEIINVEHETPSTLKELLSNVIEHSTTEGNVKKICDRLPVKTKLVAWLETSYKQYKQRADKGLIKFSLDPPRTGRLSLYSWEFILSRYRERKNYFLISKQKPFRIYMAIDAQNDSFENCTNISDINLSDIDKYPVTIKNLLTNATDLEEHFCILYGLSSCWELIGSVTKVNENQPTLQEENQTDNFEIADEKLSVLNTSYDEYNLENSPTVVHNSTTELEQRSSNEVPVDNAAQSEIIISKWFVMKVENDFTEIQFFRKGFFVKYESVIKAINVARVSGKTVRLSSQKCSNDQNDPQFGIYAIPREDDCCVFIGPYEKDESLGIEAIKKVQNIDTVIPKFLTRGIWITTNKIDNAKVIDNPLQFIPPACLNNNRMVTLDSDSTVQYNVITNDIASSLQTEVPITNKATETNIKQVKPIKIRKTNGFYHLTPNGCLKPIQSSKKSNKRSLLINTTISNLKGSLLSTKFKQRFASKRISSSKAALGTKPIAEIFPQIKSNDNIPKKQNTTLERGMFILNPEEINKRSNEKNNASALPQTSQQQTVTSHIKEEISMDVENFLEPSSVCTPTEDEIYVISDEENETSSCSMEELCENVWIACKNIKSLGWIAGKKNIKNCISFEFPGFKSSTFYPEFEALKKISQILARKVYVPKHIELQWQVVESEAEIESVNKLEEKYLAPDY